MERVDIILPYILQFIKHSILFVRRPTFTSTLKELILSTRSVLLVRHPTFTRNRKELVLSTHSILLQPTKRLNAPTSMILLYKLTVLVRMCERWVTTRKYKKCTALPKHIITQYIPKPALIWEKKDILH